MGVTVGEFIDIAPEDKGDAPTGVTPERYQDMVRAIIRGWLLTHKEGMSRDRREADVGMIIGDLKAENFIYDASSGRVKYLDLGDRQQVTFSALIDDLLRFLPSLRGIQNQAVPEEEVLKGIVLAVQEFIDERDDRLRERKPGWEQWSDENINTLSESLHLR